MEHQINDEIRDKEVRLINSDGEQLGIVPIQQAQDIAIQKGMDLVKIAPQAKREKEARKNQRIVEIKEIRLTPNIDIGDLNTKVKNACRFLKDGDKVKVSVRFRGREVTHASLGQDLLHRFAELCAECSTVEKQPKLEGRQMLMFLAPAKDK